MLTRSYNTIGITLITIIMVLLITLADTNEKVSLKVKKDVNSNAQIKTADTTYYDLFCHEDDDYLDQELYLV